LIIHFIERKIRVEQRRTDMIKNYTIKPPRKVGGTGRSATTAGAVGLGAVLIALGGLVMLGNSILDVFKKSKA
jgi:hypothetical protein